MRLTLEITRRKRTAHNPVCIDNLESHALKRSGSATCYVGAPAIRRAERLLISLSRAIADVRRHLRLAWADSTLII